MTDARPLGVVVDTMVISWLFDDRPNPLADGYRKLIGPQPVLLAFHTVMELRYGVLRAGWGDLPTLPTRTARRPAVSRPA